MDKNVIILIGVAALAFLVLQLGCGKAKEPASQDEAKAPVDLNKPVENPELVAALDAYTRNPSPGARTALTAQLNKGIYLLPILTDQAKITRSESDPGQATFEEDSLIKILTATDADGNAILPLFTDWPSIRSWTTQNVSTLVLPAQDAWGFATRGEGYSGAVINPGGHNLVLKRSELESMKRIQ